MQDFKPGVLGKRPSGTKITYIRNEKHVENTRKKHNYNRQVQFKHDLKKTFHSIAKNTEK